MRHKPYVYPSPLGDVFWNHEMESIAPYCVGLGLDIGAGGRTLRQGMVCMDLFPYDGVDVRGDGTLLPFRHNAFDFTMSCHNLEHFENPPKALLEWWRVVKPGGHLCMVVPDTDFTRGQNCDRTPHHNEWNLASFVGTRPNGQSLFNVPSKVAPQLRLVSSGQAQNGWSFHVVFEVVKASHATVKSGQQVCLPNYPFKPFFVRKSSEGVALSTEQHEGMWGQRAFRFFPKDDFDACGYVPL